MPIIETNILGSKIEIYYKKEEKEKLIHLITQFKNRLFEFENLKEKYTDNKIIFLAALKAEDEALELINRLNDQKKLMMSSNNQQKAVDNYVKEIILLKDQLSSLKNENKKLHQINKLTMNEIEKINNNLLTIINKIISTNKNDD